MGDFDENIFYFPKGRKWPSCYDCYDRARALGERIIHMQSSLAEMQTANVLIIILKWALADFNCMHGTKKWRDIYTIAQLTATYIWRWLKQKHWNNNNRYIYLQAWHKTVHRVPNAYIAYNAYIKIQLNLLKMLFLYLLGQICLHLTY